MLSMFSKKEKVVYIPMTGLFNAGKTTIVYRFDDKNDEWVRTIPSCMVYYDEMEYKHFAITAIDCAHNHKMQPILRHFLTKCKAVIFVIDSNDRKSLPFVADLNEDDGGNSNRNIHADADANANALTAKCALETCLAFEETKKDTPVLIFANKQDLPNAMTVEQIGTALGFYIETRIAIQDLLVVVDIEKDMSAKNDNDNALMVAATTNANTSNVTNDHNSAVNTATSPKRASLLLLPFSIIELILEYRPSEVEINPECTWCPNGDRAVNIVAMSARNGYGWKEGMTWLETQLAKKSQQQSNDCLLM